MSKGKVVSINPTATAEEMSDEESKKYLKEYPTREEVASFVSGYINNEVIPLILNSVGKELFQLRCRNEILLRYCVNSGLCTAEQFEKDYETYLKEQQEVVMKRQQKEMLEQELKMQEQQRKQIIVPDKTIIH